MLIHTSSFSSTSSSSSRLLQSISQRNRFDNETSRFYSRRRNLKVSSALASLKIGTDLIAEIAHNKVLIAATACAAVGQLTKPFTASILYRRDFDPKVALQAGGFPSTHSSAAVASAMSLGLERGFSDSIFGIAVVYACLTMYDAQGVRREVGVHARTLNKALTKNQFEPLSKNSFSNPESEKSPKFEETNTWHKETLVITPNKIEKESENGALVSPLLKESIGHTEIEVAAGALLGLLGSLVVYSL